MENVYEEIAEISKLKEHREATIRSKISELLDLRLDFRDLDDLKPVECKMILIKYQALFDEAISKKVKHLTGKLL